MLCLLQRPTIISLLFSRTQNSACIPPEESPLPVKVRFTKTLLEPRRALLQRYSRKKLCFFFKDICFIRLTSFSHDNYGYQWHRRRFVLLGRAAFPTTYTESRHKSRKIYTLKSEYQLPSIHDSTDFSDIVREYVKSVSHCDRH